MSENLFTTFQSHFSADQTRVFLERPNGTTLSYADLTDISGRLASVLKELGVKPGDRVAAQVEKSAEALMIYLASLRAGAVYLPLNTAYTAGEIRYFLGDAEPTLFVCGPQVAEEMRALAGEIGVAHVETTGSKGDGSLMDRARAAALGYADVPRGPDDLAAI